MTTKGPGLYRPYALPPTDGVDEIRKRVREYICLGADTIKMFGSGGIGSMDGRIHRGGIFVRNYSLEELTAGTEEAHAFRKKAAAHAIGPQPIENAINAGVDSIEHGTFLDAQLARKMAAKGIYWVPTTLVLTRYASADLSEVDDPDYIEDAKACEKALAESYNVALKAGVKIAMGTDIPFKADHGESPVELALMVERGVSEMQVIVSATKNAADLVGVGNQLGTLEKGKLADLLVVQGNPLKDITVLQDKKRLKLIMKNGEVEVDRGIKLTKKGN